jgi:hypothetical protein
VPLGHGRAAREWAHHRERVLSIRALVAAPGLTSLSRVAKSWSCAEKCVNMSDSSIFTAGDEEPSKSGSQGSIRGFQVSPYDSQWFEVAHSIHNRHRLHFGFIHRVAEWPIMNGLAWSFSHFKRVTLFLRLPPAARVQEMGGIAVRIERPI